MVKDLDSEFEICDIKGCDEVAEYRLVNDGLVVCPRCMSALVHDGEDNREDFEEL